MTEPLPEHHRPEAFVERVSLVTGEVLDGPIDPAELLVHDHRDGHVVDVYARHLMSRLVESTGDPEGVRAKMKEARRLGARAAEVIANAIGKRDPGEVAEALFGLREREFYFRYRTHPLPAEEIAKRIESLRSEAARRLAAGGRRRVLLTGGTGFVGKEVLWQAAADPEIEEVVVVIRPRVITDRKTGEVLETHAPADRGRQLLRQLWLDEDGRGDRFRFVAGDVEETDLGLDPAEIERLSTTITHVIHSAASVAFDDPYAESFRANVVGSGNALAFSHRLQSTPGSPFVAHLAIETSYIHGRQTLTPAREDEVVFPRNFYNNYYELTKAIASLETERFMLEQGLRVVQLCPAIVIGESRAGNNRGDTKVVNAPVNVFGRAGEALAGGEGGWGERSKGWLMARTACVFPGDPSAQINLIPVDRVAAGILAALHRPEAIGERIHLAADQRITSEDMIRIVGEELGVEVQLAEPTIHRNVTLPILTKILTRLDQDRIARALEKLGTIFGGYSEWGQPIHEVGNDIRILGLSPERPGAERSFRMLCRHNRYVQDYGRIRDLDEISRRERLWLDFIAEIEENSGRPAGDLPADAFREAVAEDLVLDRDGPPTGSGS